MKKTLSLARFLRPYRRWALLAPALMVLEVAMDLMQPMLVERIIDEGIASLNMQVIVNTGLLMIGLALLGAAGGLGCTIYATKAAQGFGTDLRSALFRKVQTFSFRNLDNIETGHLVTRLTNDVTQVQTVVGMLLRIMVRAPLMLVGSLIMAIITSPSLAFLIVALMPIVLLALVVVIGRATPLYSKVQSRLDDLNTVMQENLAGVRVVKAFVRAEREIQRFRLTNEKLMDLAVKAARTVGVTMPLMMLALNLGIVGAIWFGGLEAISGTMQLGQIIAFVNYLTRTLMSLMMVSMLVMAMARGQASAERMVEVLETESETTYKDDALDKPLTQGRVAFERVCFSYDEGCSDPVLQDVDFVAESGQTVALLGATGSGKSTLVHLIPRFYDVTAGRVTIDGIDVRDLKMDVLRSSVGIALQESVLFTGTIRDNIRYGRPDASEKEVLAAAQAAQAHTFISDLPDGYDTILGQRGVNLSGGQKQRLAIARSLLIKPSVLILDDSTSAVDVETEAKIQESLKGLMQGRTSFVIAQRISTVLSADKILVLDNGSIVAEGKHADLMESSSVYREIYDSQLGNGPVSDE